MGLPQEICPNCGAVVPRQARACPNCGTSDQAGWSEEASQDGLDLPDEDFDYEAFVRSEFGCGKVKPRGLRWIWWVTALVLLVAFCSWLW